MSSFATIQLESNQIPVRPDSGSGWLNVVTHLDPSYGGISNVVPRLATQISLGRSASVSLAAFCSPDESYSSVRDDLSLTLSAWPTSRAAWLRDSSLVKRFRALIVKMNGVHIHGLWEQSTFVAARQARGVPIPYVLSAHGMLDSWAIHNKRLKKALYSTLFERANVQGARCLHALTTAEVEDYRRFGANGPVAVIPNGVEIPSILSPTLFFSTYPSLEGKRLILFLGRIHFKKGLDILLKAWQQIASGHPDSHLVLAGPDSENTLASVTAAIEDLGLAQSVSLTGMLQDEMKWSAFAASECFVLPSYSEGLSVSTLEAMGAGLPVILSDRCNLPEVAAIGAGWVIAAKTTALRHAIEELLENKPQTNQVIGQRGHNHIVERYSWTQVAKQMSQVYEWVEGGNEPGSVEIFTTRGAR